MSKFPEKAQIGDDPHTQITCYHRSFLPKVKSVSDHKYQSSACLEVFLHSNSKTCRFQITKYT